MNARPQLHLVEARQKRIAEKQRDEARVALEEYRKGYAKLVNEKREDLQEAHHERDYYVDKARALERESDEWVRLILKADAASDRERALATLANMAKVSS